jgi:hypothetical protein
VSSGAGGNLIGLGARGAAGVRGDGMSGDLTRPLYLEKP